MTTYLSPKVEEAAALIVTQKTVEERTKETVAILKRLSREIDVFKNSIDLVLEEMEERKNKH